MATKSGRVIGTLALLAAAVSTGVFETRLVRMQRSLEHGQRHAVALAKPELDARNDGALVHFSGLITSNAVVLDSTGRALAHARSPIVMDPEFGVAVRGVRLTRTVEMLQWVETTHTSSSPHNDDDDGFPVSDNERERVYLYDLRWRADRVDSALFNNPSYRNPWQHGEPWQFESTTAQAPDVVVGDFHLPNALLDQIARRDVVALDTASRQTMRNVLDQRLGERWRDHSALANVSIYDEHYFVARATNTRDAAATSKVQNMATYTPALGDLRVSFSVTPALAVTICAQQQGKSLVPFATADESIYLLDDGIHSVTALFDRQTASKFKANRFKRLFASVVGFIGFVTLHPLLLRHARVLQIVAAGAIPAPVAAATLSCLLTSVVIAVCWLQTRFLYAAAMLAGGAVPTLVLLGVAHALQRAKQE